jgi:hypothetical protein
VIAETLLSTEAMQITDELYRKVQALAIEVKEDFRAKGIVLPTKGVNGIVKLGNYTVARTDKGFYSVLDARSNLVYSQINLPQTALLLANSLALGKWVDSKLLEHDKQYGFSSFETDNYNRLSKTFLQKEDWTRYDALLIKQEAAQERAEESKNFVLRLFEKLRRLR